MTTSSEQRPRVMVIGLDGATLDLAEPWLKAGQLPHLARLSQQGGYGPLRSVWPVLSPSAWASFATGVNPGRHGIFDFVQRAPESYALRLVTARDLRAPTLWRLLSEAGKRVAVINVPMTYPPEPVNGVMITGLGTPDQQVFTHPPELSQTLRARGYRVNKDVFYRPGREAAFLKEVYALTDHVAETALDILQREAWDFFMVVFRDTDELAHFFWKHMDAAHPAHQPQTDPPWSRTLLEYYQYLDRWVGKLMETAGPEVDIIIMSDHGMGPLYKDVYLNEWLRQKGWLNTLASTPSSADWLGKIGLTRSNISRALQTVGLARFERSLRRAVGESAKFLPANNRLSFPEAIDWRNTQACSYGYHGQIFLNVLGREPQGVVEPLTTYPKLVSEIEQALMEIQDPDDGRPIVSRIIPQSEAFHGPYATWGPDLVVVMRGMSYITRQGYEFSAGANSFFSSPNTHESGSHRIDGLFFVAGPSFRASGKLRQFSILDLAPTIMYLMGYSVAQNMDGIPMVEVINERENQLKDLSYVYGGTANDGGQGQLNEEEEKELTERLKNLGYLG